MGEIEIDLNDQDLEFLKEHGALQIPHDESIIDKEPIITLNYD